jgi:hypothetical protein
VFTILTLYDTIGTNGDRRPEMYGMDTLHRNDSRYWDETDEFDPELNDYMNDVLRKGPEDTDTDD